MESTTAAPPVTTKWAEKKANITKQTCLCGRPAIKIARGGPVCARCNAWEEPYYNHGNGFCKMEAKLRYNHQDLKYLKEYTCEQTSKTRARGIA